ncbi:MAG TPA: T9SS type A sorting domain-containing protein [Bacteroidales bacterium]
MKKITLSIAFTLITYFIFSQSVIKYNFEGSLNSVNGNGPALTVLGNTGTFVTETLNEIEGNTKTVYRFEKNNGVQFNNTAAGNFIGNAYTIEIYFVFDELNSWKRVIDWKNRKTDRGAYVYNGKLNFYNIIYSAEAPVAAGEYTYYVVTRDESGKVLIYTDAEVFIDFMDTGSDALVDEDGFLNFFFDDLQVTNEASSGAVAMINLYNYALDSSKIADNWDGLGGQVFGINEMKVSPEELAFYPNPASEVVNLDLSTFTQNDEVSIDLMTIAGMQIYSSKVKGGNTGQINLKNLSLAKGLYVIKATSKEKVAVAKVMIK